MSDWSPLDLFPGLYVFLLAAGLAALLRRWYDPVPGRVLAVFGLVLLLLFAPVLFGGGVLLPLGNLLGTFPFRHLAPPDTPSIALQGDLVNQIAPWALEVRRVLMDGRWPLWNPHAGAGMPLLADPQVQAFQPLVVLAYLFPFWPAVGITAALRVLVALVFGFLLLRRQGLGERAALGGSLAFGLGGFLLLWLGWPMANSAALLPPVLYGISRCDDYGAARDLLLLFLATAALLLAGHPETVTYSLAFAGLFLLARVRRRQGSARPRLLARSGVAMALAAAAVSPVLLPVLDYLPKTDRAVAVAFHLAPAPVGELWGRLMQPEGLELWRTRAESRLVPIVAPRAYGNHDWYWGSGNLVEDSSGFVGNAALLAAAVALLPLRRRRRFPQERLAILALIGCLLLVAQPPGLDRLLGQLPLVGPTFIHQSHRLLLIVSFCLAVLAACEVQRRALGEGSRWPVLAAAAILAALVAWGYFAHPNPTDPTLLADFRNLYLSLHLVTLALATVLLAARPQGRWGLAVPWLFCGLVGGELLLVHRPLLPPAPRRLAYPVTPPVRFLRQHLGDYRMLGLGGSAFPANFPLVHGLNDVRIDNPSLPAVYAAVTAPLRPKPPRFLFARPTHPLYDLLGARYVLTRPGIRLPYPRVFQHPAGWIYERPKPLPRLFLPARAVVFRQGDWLAWLARNPDFARRALVQSSRERSANWRARFPRKSRLALAFPEPARVSARGFFVEPRLLASSVYQDGHWHLLAARERRETVLANGPFVGAWLPAGEQRIDLLYRPRVFVAGCLLAALAVAAAAAWWVPMPRRE